MDECAIVALGKANSEYSMNQQESIECYKYMFKNNPDICKLVENMIPRAMIEKRHFCHDLKDKNVIDELCNLTIEERLNRTEKSLLILSKKAALSAIKDWGGSIDDIDDIIVASGTSFSAPTLDMKLINELGLKDTTRCLFVGMKACASSGLALIDAVARCATFKSNVLLVCVDVAGPISTSQNVDINRAIGAILFGDGAAACIISPTINTPKENIYWTINKNDMVCQHTLNTLDNMSIKVKDDVLVCFLDKNVHINMSNIALKIQEKLLRNRSLDIGSYLCHPGGKSIVQQIQKSLSLSEDQVESSVSVLKNYGNMSSPTMLFVLNEEAKHNKNIGKHDIAMCFGQGLTGVGIVMKRESKTMAM